MKIAKLTVENIMRVSAVEIEPTGAVVVIGGKNGQGKTSILTAIEMALGGGKSAVDKPVREGAEGGKVVVDLGDIVVERRFTAAGGTSLAVRNKDGARFDSPQGMLDAMLGRLTFDPLAFARSDPKKRLETLKIAAKVDFSAVDAHRAKLYEQRTQTNRLVEVAKGRVAAFKFPEGTPAEAPDTSALLAELERRRQINDRHGVVKATIDVNNITVNNYKNELSEIRSRVAKLEEAIQNKTNENDKLAAELGALPPLQNLAEINEQIKAASAVAAAVNVRKQHEAAVAELGLLEDRSKELTGAISLLDADKAKAMSEIQLPVPGLGFNDAGVTFNGVPFEQASGAEQLRASVAIGIALNPKLKVMLVRDGSLLDDDGMKMLSDMAEAAGSQIWVERVGRDKSVSFVIEDGHLVAERVVDPSDPESPLVGQPAAFVDHSKGATP